ncbi:hypothetical protein BDD12DRAFT_818983 [Trichophaea hybrida]|nr:hypothetical protein BDD12DRAFT_818983 [Trichophaea hybrida]
MTPRTTAFLRLISSKSLQRSISAIHISKPLKLPSVHFQNAFLFLPPALGTPRCFSSSPSRCGEKDQTLLKEAEGKQEAEAHLGVRKGTEELARTQSVPWHRASDGKPPLYQHRKIPDSEKSSVIPNRRGKLVSTPSRLLKLLLPLRPKNSGRPTPKDSEEPLALLIHPHQPLSYLERLIQAEILPLETPTITRPPDITFLAHDPSSPSSSKMTRWSAATEVGDFVHDASKGQEFIISIENSPSPLTVKVPSFHDRTYFLRQRLRAVSSEIEKYSKLKQECDQLAQRGAQKLALGGFAGLVSWWGCVWFLTFHTSLGWDVMEPVTYLAGLTMIMLSYLWFLYHNREVSYRSVLHLTVSRRQVRLYAEKGFDLERWGELIDDGKALRREIRMVAEQYDVQWNEKEDEVGSERVKKALDAGKEKKTEREEEDEEARE